ncbi:MAG TPA: hypothetical protein VKD90_25110 [Gemmataceae bacterium]|nr:hypothetical protein [Gemmataceae bacterium]
MKGVLGLILGLAIILGIWKFFSPNDFLQPWKAWSNWIGYFQ